MREIKFRTWTGQQMDYNIMAGFLGAFYVQGIDEYDSASMSQFNTKYPENCHVMQFTGLLDKNGKEIYEGDIVKTETEKNMAIGWDKRYASFVIEHDGWAFKHYFGEAFESVDCEVIGNLYENPDLL